MAVLVALIGVAVLGETGEWSVVGSAGSAASTTCDVVAGHGNEIETAQGLVDSLAPGQVGCLRAGTYAADKQVKVVTPAITLRSYPGERATLRTRLWIAEGANDVTVEGLDLDGSNGPPCAENSCEALPSPTVNANGAVFRGNDITNHRADSICFNLGSRVWGRANQTIIESNRIHDCGSRPPTNHAHGIYVARAAGTVIRDNLIYDNADRGIQLYPDSDGARITGNVIDGNGEGILFSGSGEDASSDNLVEGNLITNSNVRYNVESYYSEGAPVGTGNVVRRNCIHGGARDEGNGGIQEPQRGFGATDNVIADPLYVDRRRKDFRLQESSPCASVIGAGSADSRSTYSAPAAPATSPVMAAPVTLTASATRIRPRQRFRLRGSVAAERMPKRVRLLRRGRGGWRRGGTASIRRGGRFAKRHRAPSRPGVLRFRAKAPRIGKSDAVRLRVAGRRR